jgi:TRAP transporter 4TM/12TM fusion protein
MRQRLADRISKVFFVLGSIFSLYIFTTIIELFQDPSQHYTTFVLGIAVLSSLLTIRDILNSDSRGFKFWLTLSVFFCASVIFVAVGIYLRYYALHLTIIQPFLDHRDIVVGFFMLVSLLMLTWYHWGTILTVMITLAILYVFGGHLLQSPILTHDHFSLDFAMSYMGMDTVGGIFWFVPLAADKIYFLIIFAALLIGIGMLPLVIEMGKWMGRYVKGGAAFPAIVGSAMTGSVMGQAVSNTMLTGQLTIPMMKKHGYKPDFAGAVEAVASTSGQLLPPILGLAAFIIAAFLNIAYIEVALRATLPALLFVAGVTIAILLAARVFDLGYLREKVDKELIFRLMPTFAGSFFTVLVLLLMYYSPNVAAISGIGLMMVLAVFQGKKYRPKLKTIVDGLTNGLEVCTVLCLLLLAIGPIAQMATVTNLAGKLSIVLTGVVPHNLLLILIGTMIVSLILGMGLPTPVAYLVVALTLAPFLQELGVPALYAHLFVFYFAIFSTISPPVAISCLAASKLSGGSFVGTAQESMKIALPTFIIPFVFIYNPDLLSFPGVTIAGLIAFVLTLLVMITFEVTMHGFFIRKLQLIERLAFGITTFLGLCYLLNHTVSYLTGFLGLGVVASLWVFLSQRRRQKTEAAAFSRATTMGEAQE